MAPTATSAKPYYQEILTWFTSLAPSNQSTSARQQPENSPSPPQQAINYAYEKQAEVTQQMQQIYSDMLGQLDKRLTKQQQNDLYTVLEVTSASIVTLVLLNKFGAFESLLQMLSNPVNSTNKVVTYIYGEDKLDDAITRINALLSPLMAGTQLVADQLKDNIVSALHLVPRNLLGGAERQLIFVINEALENNAITHIRALELKIIIRDALSACS